MISRRIMRSVALAGVMLVGAAVLKLAAHLHVFGADSANRGAQILIGLTLAVFANYIPKGSAAAPRSTESLRHAGWVFSIAGLAYAVIWAVSPASLAFPRSMAVLGGAIVATIGSCAWSLAF
jgi:hypothetical protein